MADLFANIELPSRAPAPFESLEAHRYAAILADPPWKFEHWGKNICDRDPENYYDLMTDAELGSLPVKELGSKDCVLFIWITWPKLAHAMWLIERWRFEYKTCAFCWTKADNTQPHFFEDELTANIGLGYWTRANSEVCLLATRGQPKRLNADVRQAIIAPRREHSRKPEIRDRIERLVAGPYLELFARQGRPGWATWGNEKDKFDVSQS